MLWGWEKECLVQPKSINSPFYLIYFFMTILPEPKIPALPNLNMDRNDFYSFGFGGINNFKV